MGRRALRGAAPTARLTASTAFRTSPSPRSCRRAPRHDHYLKGLLFCGECGRRLSLTLAKGRYLYFYCLGQRGQTRTGCRQPYLLAVDAEALLENVYRRVQLPASWVEQLTAEMEAEIAERRAGSMERRTALTKKLAKIADERQKLLRAFHGNAIPIELLRSEQDRLTGEERAAKQGARCRRDRYRRLGGRPADRDQARRQLSRGVPEGPTFRAPTLQPGGARGRLRQGPRDRPGGVLGGVRTPLLAPGFE